MSSLYKRGRDGYYYYQTYLYNKESGKKDKKIFHSLNTKNRQEALIKKKRLDDDYKKRIERNKNNKKNNKNKLLLLLFLVFFISFIAIYQISKNKIYYVANDGNQLNEIDLLNVILVDSVESIQIVKKKDNRIVSKEIIDQKDQLLKSIKKRSSIEKNNIKIDPILNQNKLSNQRVLKEIPTYTIQRIEKLSSVFNQIKIYLTVEDETPEDALRLLCKKLKNEYNDFSNIIICIYSDNRSGISLSKGESDNLDIRGKKNAWLAMYSYNPVEGDYFDNTPSQYLGFK